jgi:hypothetical protein
MIGKRGKRVSQVTFLTGETGVQDFPSLILSRLRPQHSPAIKEIEESRKNTTPANTKIRAGRPARAVVSNRELATENWSYAPMAA